MSDGPIYGDLDELLAEIHAIAWCVLVAAEPVSEPLAVGGRRSPWIVRTPIRLVVTDCIWGAARTGQQWDWSLIDEWTTSAVAHPDCHLVPSRVLAFAAVTVVDEWARVGLFDLDDTRALRPIAGSSSTQFAPFLQGLTEHDLRQGFAGR